jgi:Ca2+-binding EF-hand superfamily protein
LEELRHAGSGGNSGGNDLGFASDVSASGAGTSPRLTPEVLAAYFDVMDTNGDGAISRQEFLTFARRTGLRNFLD